MNIANINLIVYLYHLMFYPFFPLIFTYQLLFYSLNQED